MDISNLPTAQELLEARKSPKLSGFDFDCINQLQKAADNWEKQKYKYFLFNSILAKIAKKFTTETVINTELNKNDEPGKKIMEVLIPTVDLEGLSEVQKTLLWEDVIIQVNDFLKNSGYFINVNFGYIYVYILNDDVKDVKDVKT